MAGRPPQPMKKAAPPPPQRNFGSSLAANMRALRSGSMGPTIAAFSNLITDQSGSLAAGDKVWVHERDGHVRGGTLISAPQQTTGFCVVRMDRDHAAAGDDDLKCIQVHRSQLRAPASGRGLFPAVCSDGCPVVVACALAIALSSIDAPCSLEAAPTDAFEFCDVGRLLSLP
ncbi:hypothetical protein M885DRAFT_216684 [Pelagophyceae sp. CCMP2097]|nr:hypothetical protein M885DRAFT_216684 [Pelagophyceae sp. CCMP2097]